jgi:serine-type D-Ala-D-Ala carboxypeptidase
MSTSDPLAEALQTAVEEGVFPGAVLMVRLRGDLVYQHAKGYAAITPVREPVSLETIYDLASLTKPLATATAILCLVQDGLTDLDEPVETFLQELKGAAVGQVKIFHLLNHSSGLPGWRPFYERVVEQDREQPGFLGSKAAQQMVLALIGQEMLEYPTGARSLYSDLGFILLGMVVERVTGCSLARFCTDRIYRSIGAQPLFFTRKGGEIEGNLGPAAFSVKRVAPTELNLWRGRMLRAEVHDENAYAFGGIAGHAGLFGTASSVLTMAGLWIESYLTRNRFLSPDLVRRFASRQTTPGSSWGLGWDTPSIPSSSGGYFSSNSFGHLGFTGTSLWIDPVTELEVVLLSNRVHCNGDNRSIQKFRPFIHDLIYEEIVERKRRKI